MVGLIKFIVYASGDGWRVKTISNKHFVSRVYIAPNIMEYLPLADQVTFIHNKRFIAATTTEKAAHEIAATSIMLHDVAVPAP